MNTPVEQPDDRSTTQPAAPATDAGLAGRFHAMQKCYQEARDQRPIAFHDIELLLAGQPVRMGTVGRQLHEVITRPLGHLARVASVEPPQLSIDLWDEDETAVTGPGCAVDPSLGVDGVITVSPDGRFIGYRRARSFTVYDRQDRAMVGWSRYADQACLYELGRPLHVPLALWHCDTGGQVVHAGLVAVDDAGVLFPGMGGSGKSTSSLTCLAAGLSYLGDDYIGLTTSGEQFIGHSIYCSSHLEPHHLKRFPDLVPHATAPTTTEEDKSLVLLDHLYPGQLRPSVAIRAIAMPRVVDAGRTSIQPASKTQALLALAPSSIVMIPGRGRHDLDRLGDLVQSVPCYFLNLGRDLASIAPQVVRLVHDAMDPTTAPARRAG